MVQWLKDNFSVTRVVDLSSYEDKGQYLEGTGSIVFDHTARVAYACSSVRTDTEVLDRLCAEIGYNKLLVEAKDSQGMGTDVCVYCIGICDHISHSYREVHLPHQCVHVHRDRLCGDLHGRCAQGGGQEEDGRQLQAVRQVRDSSF